MATSPLSIDVLVVGLARMRERAELRSARPAPLAPFLVARTSEGSCDCGMRNLPRECLARRPSQSQKNLVALPATSASVLADLREKGRFEIELDIPLEGRRDRDHPCVVVCCCSPSFRGVHSGILPGLQTNGHGERTIIGVRQAESSDLRCLSIRPLHDGLGLAKRSPSQHAQSGYDSSFWQ
ncbi:hypothetical protein EMCG_01466 [[Emmonsia] crescens]|uniref:Uncharacterized protein n=1 Tax=[Emmonsia] crescens TaxID=73230 RepID=A0A0G2J9M5_9EURO|nr:hypothetical protein EMCG_01466 [Emmonsia crescens UAMH 3008]